MVNAWVRGNVGSHCSAERPLPGATGSGGTLQFVLVRYPGGYRIALGADEWELKPQTAFPVEINAQPVMRSDANADALSEVNDCYGTLRKAVSNPFAAPAPKTASAK
jgi:hypothetical protein